MEQCYGDEFVEEVYYREGGPGDLAEEDMPVSWIGYREEEEEEEEREGEPQGKRSINR